jgi:hypothetical protein
MTTTVEAIYEGGKLILPSPLPLPDKSHVTVTIETHAPDSDGERAVWLELSKQSLMKVWNNTDDDIFNELLSK